MIEYSSEPDESHQQSASKRDKSSVATINPTLREKIKETRAAIADNNEKARTERNARRRKSKRNTLQDKADKQQKREEYAAKIRLEEGREVRSYQKVKAETPAERAEIRRKRDAERKRKSWSNALQAQKDAKADKVWAARQRVKKVPEAEISAGLERRRAKRQMDQPNDYQNNPEFGMF